LRVRHEHGAIEGTLARHLSRLEETNLRHIRRVLHHLGSCLDTDSQRSHRQ
jgi:hypothetical protein